MKVAITRFGSLVSPLFDTAQWLFLVNVERGKVLPLREEPLAQLDLTEKFLCLIQNGVQALICGAISGFFQHALLERGIKVFPWVSGDVEDILSVFALRTVFEEGLADKRPLKSIAVTATGPGLDDHVSPSLGGCRYCVIVSPMEDGHYAVENLDLSSIGGGCLQISKQLIKAGASVLLTGKCGPNALGIFSISGIEVILGVEGRIEGAVKHFIDGNLMTSSKLGSILTGENRHEKRPLQRKGHGWEGATLRKEQRKNAHRWEDATLRKEQRKNAHEQNRNPPNETQNSVASNDEQCRKIRTPSKGSIEEPKEKSCAKQKHGRHRRQNARKSSSSRQGKHLKGN